jgi:hypothetical protein
MYRIMLSDQPCRTQPLPQCPAMPSNAFHIWASEPAISKLEFQPHLRISERTPLLAKPARVVFAWYRLLACLLVSFVPLLCFVHQPGVSRRTTRTRRTWHFCRQSAARVARNRLQQSRRAGHRQQPHHPNSFPILFLLQLSER